MGYFLLFSYIYIYVYMHTHLKLEWEKEIHQKLIYTFCTKATNKTVLDLIPQNITKSILVLWVGKKKKEYNLYFPQTPEAIFCIIQWTNHKKDISTWWGDGENKIIKRKKTHLVIYFFSFKSICHVTNR